MSNTRNCENCKHFFHCPYLHLFNKDTSVGCLDFQDKDYGLNTVSNTISSNAEEKQLMNKELTTTEMLERFLLLANVFHKEYGIRNDEDVVKVEKGKYVSKYDYRVYLKIKIALEEKTETRSLTNDETKQLMEKHSIEIIKKHKLLNYVLKNPKCASMYHLSEEEIQFLKEQVCENTTKQ